jgi:hypothetical protein
VSIGADRKRGQARDKWPTLGSRVYCDIGKGPVVDARCHPHPAAPGVGAAIDAPGVSDGEDRVRCRRCERERINGRVVRQATLERCQLPPPPALRNTPAPALPASTTDGSAGDVARDSTVPPYSRAGDQELTPARAGATGSTVSSADSPAMKISANCRHFRDGAMNPFTIGPDRCPFHS